MKPWFALLVVTAGCELQLTDPCANVSGTCLALQVDSTTPRVDTLSVHLTGGGLDTGKSLVSGGAVSLPLAVGLVLDRLPRSPAELHLTLFASSNGQPLEGDQTVTITAGTHPTVHVQLAPFSAQCLAGPDPGDAKPTPPCTPTRISCPAAIECGVISDGCGGTIDCGSCKLAPAWTVGGFAAPDLHSDPSAVGRKDGKDGKDHIKVFYDGPPPPPGSLNRLSFFGRDDGIWGQPQWLNGLEMPSAPSAVVFGSGPNGDGYRVFYQSPDNHLVESPYDGGQWWGAVGDLGALGLASAPSAVLDATNKIWIFYQGANGHLWYIQFDGAQALGAAVDVGVSLKGAPAALMLGGAPANLRVFYRGQNDHLWMSSYDGTSWVAVDLHVTPGGDPTAVEGPSSTFDVFYASKSNELTALHWGLAEGFGPPEHLGVVVPDHPTPSALKPTEVYYRSADGHLGVATPNLSPFTDTIDKSGLYSVGPMKSLLLVTQGVSGSTLVAGKQLLFRVFMDTKPTSSTQAITLSISANGGPTRTVAFAGTELLTEWALAPFGPSVGAIVPGSWFPNAGEYQIVLSASDADRNELSRLSFQATFLPTVDLRLAVVMMKPANILPPTLFWYRDVERALARLASILPIRDGVAAVPDAPSCSGMRYTIATPCDQSAGAAAAADCAYRQTRDLDNKLGSAGAIDLTIEYRPGFYAQECGFLRDLSPSGNSARPAAPYADLRQASCVAGLWNGVEITAPCLAQQIGLNYGLMAPDSPSMITDLFAFDFIKRVRFTGGLGDANSDPEGTFGGIDHIAYKAVDWETLRQQLVAQSGSNSGAACAP
jgi:hypothetical protein